MVSIIKETFTGTDLSITNHEVNGFSNSFQDTRFFYKQASWQGSYIKNGLKVKQLAK